MANGDALSLKQLAEAADVTPRTIRYYVAQGLLPSPEQAGPNTRYTSGHLERLRLIKRLQAAHLPLATIRSQLDALGDNHDLLSTAPATPPVAPSKESAADYIRSVLHEPAPRPMAARATFAPTPAWLQAPRSTTQPDRSQWDRVVLSPDVELHVRRPLTRDHNRRVDRLIAAARELLQEDKS
jgi:DNA-binding transcriptional MerR regulator